MGTSHGNLDRDKVDIKALGSLISLYINMSSRALQNGIEMLVLFFERLLDIRKTHFFLFFGLLVDSN